MLRRTTMLASLGLFTLLLTRGKLQIWMFVILASVFLALVLGRFFCGWLCPINTFIELGTWLKKKLGLKNHTPSFLQNSLWGYALLLLVIGGFLLSRLTGKNIPLLLFMIPLGAIISFTFSPAAWHHWLCPYNVLFKITGGWSLLRMAVGEQCTGCTRCQKVCPAEAITLEQGKAKIDNAHCLICTACQGVCPAQAINYGRFKEFQETQAS